MYGGARTRSQTKKRGRPKGSKNSRKPRSPHCGYNKKNLQMQQEIHHWTSTLLPKRQDQQMPWKKLQT